MAEFTINDEDLTPLKDKVIVVTGGSSGIGLETVKLLLSLGAAGVVSGDLHEPPATAFAGSGGGEEGGSAAPAAFTHRRTDVTVWADLLALFREARERHGRVDHAFISAGIGPKARYFWDDEGADAIDPNDDDNLPEPTAACLDVNLRAAINASALAIRHIGRNPAGVDGSVVAACSITSVTRFSAPDYAATKHGLLGFVRGMHSLLAFKRSAVRINAIAPSWTDTAINPASALAALGVAQQPASVPARSVALLMADAGRKGQLVLSSSGVFREIDEAALLPAWHAVAGPRLEDENVSFERLLALRKLAPPVAEAGKEEVGKEEEKRED